MIKQRTLWDEERKKMTFRQVLTGLNIVQHCHPAWTFERDGITLPQLPRGGPKRMKQLLDYEIGSSALKNDAPRKSAMRLANYPICIGCSKPIPLSSTRDHLVPDGPHGPENIAPLEKRCNSSKGRKDFFEWLETRRIDFFELPPELTRDILLVYTRVKYNSLNRDQLNSMAPDYLLRLFEDGLEFCEFTQSESLVIYQRLEREEE